MFLNLNLDVLGACLSRGKDKLEIRRSKSRLRLTSETLTLKIIIFWIITLIIATLLWPGRQTGRITDQIENSQLNQIDKRLIDLNDFEITSNRIICSKKDDKNKLLQIGIHSSRRNYNRRAVIRNTWGKIKFYKGWEISIAFLLGSSPKHEQRLQGNTMDVELVEQIVKNESEIFKDLVIGNFIDSYRNLTYKHMMGYKWVLNSCHQVDAYIKTDDDVFLNIHKTIHWLVANKLDDHFYCYVLQGYSPWRSKKYKFYISKDEYKPNTFPDYCSGIGYITRPSLMSKLYNVSLTMRYLWVEDLFTTGLLTKYYNDRAAKLTAEINLWDGEDSTFSTPAKIHLVDRSEVYLNEQYAIYKRWIDDSSKLTNPWLFILLEKKNEQDVVMDQRKLWEKTSIAYQIDNVH